MDGTLAILFLAASLGDMSLNYCGEGCVRRDEAQARLNFGISKVEFQDQFVSNELFFSYDFGVKFGPFQPSISASFTDQGAAWIGIGPTWDRNLGDFFVTASLMPGLYASEGGNPLGGSFHFRATVGAGYEFDNGGRIAITYDHRSNADTQNLNPGLETVGIRYSVPFR